MSKSSMHKFPLETERLRIRNWQEGDRELFYLINSDAEVMKFFPFRRTREEADKRMDQERETIAKTGLGFTAIALKETDEPIGFCGLADAGSADGVYSGLVEIGWRLAPRFQGKGYVTEAAKRLLEYGFETLELPEIVAFAVPENKASTAVMDRIGMTHDPSRDFAHPNVPDTHPELIQHVFYAVKNPDKKGA